MENRQLSMEVSENELFAFGSAIDTDRDFARQQAVLLAKVQMVSGIKSLALSTLNSYYEKTKRNGLSISESDKEQDAGMIAEVILEDCKIVYSKRNALSDGTYEYVVCISTTIDSAGDVVGAIVLSEDEKLNVEFDIDKCMESYEEQLECYRATKNEK